MRFPLATTLALFAGGAALVGACGPNVILDGESTSTATGTPKGTGGAGFGGASVNATSAQGGGNVIATTSTVTPGTGGGFAGPSTVTVGPGGGFGGNSAVSVGPGGGFSGPSSVAVGSATSTGTGVVGACTDGVDSMELDGNVIYPLVVMCAMANLGNSAAETKCIESGTGLSPACTGCIVDDLLCSLKACIQVCASDPNGASCKQCRDQSCSGAFVQCSGLAYAPGSTTCNDLLVNATKGSGWQLDVPAEAFISTNGQDAYHELFACGCEAFNPVGCEGVCNDQFSNGPPDFCNGAQASSQCLTCLEGACGSQFMTCVSDM